MVKTLMKTLQPPEDSIKITASFLYSLIDYIDALLTGINA